MGRNNKKNNLNHNKIFVAIASLMFCGNLVANPLSSSYHLEDIVVTGTKTSKPITDAPVRTEIINEKTIFEKNYKDVSEAILEIPGVTLQDQTGRGGKSAVIQGLSGEHVLVLIDGVPIMQRSSSGVDLTSISTVGVKQIEVVKGGASALYGGQAMGGVINIITKKPKKGAYSRFSFEKTFDQSGHSLPFNSLKVLNQGKQGNLSHRITFSKNKVQSVDRDKSTITKDTPDFDKNNLSFWLERKLRSQKEISFKLESHFEKNEVLAAKALGTGSFRESLNQSKTNGNKISCNFKHRLNANTDYKLVISHEKVEDEFKLDDDPKTSYVELTKDSTGEQNHFESQLNHVRGSSHILSIGVVSKVHTLDQNNISSSSSTTTKSTKEISNKSTYSNEAYFQDDWLLGEAELVTGLRYTKDKYFGEKLSPKLNYSYFQSYSSDLEGTYRLSFGSGYRAPNLKERFYILDHRSFAGYIVYGNENLAPETSQSFQVSYDLNFKKTMSFNVGIFRNDVKDLIIVEELQINSSDKKFSYGNINKAQITGYDLGATFKFQNNLKLRGSLNHTKAVNTSSGNVIPNRPFYTAKIELEKKLLKRKMKVNLQWMSFGESYANKENTEGYDGYALTNIHLNYALKKTRFTFGIKNILDVKRSPAADQSTQVNDLRPALGRSLYTGLSYEI